VKSAKRASDNEGIEGARVRCISAYGEDKTHSVNECVDTGKGDAR